MLPLHCPGAPNVVTNDCARSDGKRFRIGDVELLELGFTLPHLPQEIRENVDRELLAGTATIPETEGRIASIVADRQRLAIDDSIHRAKATILQRGFSAILDVVGLSVEGALGKADLLTAGFVDLVARRHAVVRIEVELSRILPMAWVETGC